MFLYSINDKSGWISFSKSGTGNSPVTWKSLVVVNIRKDYYKNQLGK